MKKTALITFLTLLLPAVASAQVSGNNLTGLLNLTGDVLNRLIPILIAAALVIFFWGLVRYVLKAGGEGGDGRGIMIAGLTALFIMVSVWGIVRLAQNTLGVTDQSGIAIPQVPTSH